MSLLHYIIHEYVYHLDPHAGTDMALLPIPEPSDVAKASLMNFDETADEIKKLNSSLDGNYYYFQSKFS